VSRAYLFSGDIFQNEEFMEDYVADIAAPPMEAAAYSSNSELPAILMIYYYYFIIIIIYCNWVFTRWQ
jgi:hypothetical protein